MTKSWNQKEIKIIHCFGDSLTAGFGVLPGQGWVELLDKRIQGISFYNHGACGTGVRDIFDLMEGFTTRPGKAEGFFFMGGTNDILCGLRLDVLERIVEIEVGNISEKVPLTLGIPIPATEKSIYTGWQQEDFFEANQKDLEKYGEFLRSLSAELFLPFIDFQKALPADDRYYSDGIHPNRTGYERMADCAEKLWKS
ncbi:GDSL-type esterase/lipase family protein [uncultured Dialister sp.]|uniref:SGNH/GDSL hydrolase family protein n=1 Tax=uncultured Dialister sp. TaxID=278064 RepID=UPI0025DB60EB|nr:GDSL-type esterase/lipase family protein [uncultured Dialister sp.]